MKKLACLTLILCFAIALGACSTIQRFGGKINPGDILGDFMVTTGEEGQVIFPSTEFCSPDEDTGVYTCKSTIGNLFVITTGIYDDSGFSETPSAKLEQDWAAYEYEVTIDGKPVNLEAFGYFEILHPIYGLMRYWNVAIVSNMPGEITVQESGVTEKGAFTNMTTYRFSEP